MSALRSLLRRRRIWAPPLLAALCCAACAAWYLHADADAELSYSAARDAALAQGRADVAALSSMDSAHPDAALQSWLAVTSGSLHESLAHDTGPDVTALVGSGVSLQAAVTDAALTELDTRAGTAQLIATVNLTVKHVGGSGDGQERKRFEATLACSGTVWTVTDLTALAAGTA